MWPELKAGFPSRRKAAKGQASSASWLELPSWTLVSTYHPPSSISSESSSTSSASSSSSSSSSSTSMRTMQQEGKQNGPPRTTLTNRFSVLQSFRCTQKKHYYDYSFIIMKKQPRNKGLVNIAWPTESVHKYACKFIYYVYYAYSYLYILLHTYTCIHIICIHILDTLRKQNHTDLWSQAVQNVS